MAPTLIILSGITGAGKSRFAKSLFNVIGICSADDLFTDPATGQYNFDPSKIGDAPGACFRKALELAQRAKEGETIIVDNTNTTVWEIAPYMAIAQAYRLEAEIITIRCSVEVALTRNIHGVPEATVKRMAENLDKRELLPWWKNRVLYPL